MDRPAELTHQVGIEERRFADILRWRPGYSVILLGIMIAAAVTIGTALLIFAGRAHTIEEAKRNLHSLALVLGDQVERSFQAVEVVENSAVQRLRTAGVTSDASLRLIASTEDWHGILRDWADTLPNMDAIAIVDSSGKLVNTSRFWPAPALDVVDRDYFQALRGDPSLVTFISQPARNRITGAWTVYVAHKLTAPDRAFLGIITGAVLLSDLERFYSSISSVDEMAIALFRRDGTLLARYPRVDDALAKADAARSPVFVSLRSASETVIQQSSVIDGTDRFIAAKALQKYPLVVSVSNTVEAALSTWRHQTTQMVTIALIMDLAVAVAGLLGLSRIRASESMAQTASQLARRDPLTGLPNRLCFNEAMENSTASLRRDGTSFAILILDLDLFKEVNDTLGHAVGDDLLRAVAARLRTSLRKGDMVARLGGDEFAIIQAEAAGRGDVESLAGRLIGILSAPYSLGRDQIVIGVSIGAALFPEDATDSSRLLRSADLALYRAKAGGRRTFRFFLPEMEDQINQRRSFESDLRNAVENGSFELAYQPLLNLRSQRIAGFEALLRWDHPERGYISPAEFIPIAEDIGVIGELGEWVLNTACERAAAWPSWVKLSVNLSPVQFKLRDFVHYVKAALQRSQLPAGRLELEITESVLIEDSNAAGSMLRELKALGVSIALDDFGTGYSSLSYLRKFPFDKIKIDQSFVQEMEKSDDCAAIVSTTLMLASRLGMTTTAEGVETVEQLNALRAQGCTQAQGYLISPPVKGDDVRLLLDRSKSSLEAVA